MKDINDEIDGIMAKAGRMRWSTKAEFDDVRAKVGLVLNAFMILSLASPRAAEATWDAIGTALENANDATGH